MLRQGRIKDAEEKKHNNKNKAYFLVKIVCCCLCAAKLSKFLLARINGRGFWEAENFSFS